MGTKRFSKAAALAGLDRRVADIATSWRFDRSNGTAQLMPRGASDEEKARIQRAVEYGRMRALESFAEDIESGFVA